MNKKEKKFVSRAPRLYLYPDDKLQLRISTQPVKGGGHLTDLNNLSTTGLAFISEPHWTPFIGDVIDIHLNIDSVGPLNWQARVMRLVEMPAPKPKFPRLANPKDSADESTSINSRTDNPIYVGVHFINVPDEQTQIIEKWVRSIKKQQQLKEFRATINLAKNWVITYGLKITLYLTFIGVVSGLLYWLMKPSVNYDKEKGAPWGHRFELFDFNKQKK